MASRTWCFTLNNYTDDEVDFLTKEFYGICTRLLIGKEIGECGTPHLQGAFTLRRTKRLNALKKLLSRAHFEKCKADEIENRVYCKKPDAAGHVDTLFDYVSTLQGQRNDITDFYENAKQKGIKRAALEDPSTYVKFHKGLHLVDAIYRETQCVTNASYNKFNIDFLDLNKFMIIWGPSGVGKTQYALAHFTRPLLCCDLEDLRKYDPDLHDGVVFDDMDFRDLPRSAMIHLVDMEFTRSIHMRYQNWDKPAGLKIIATTNLHGGNIFGNHFDDPAIVRRIETFHVDEFDLYPHD